MKIRRAAVAGSFYPGNANQLKNDIQKYLSETKAFDEFPNIAGIISPHAGYIFSGLITANGFKVISHLKPKNIIVLSPSHREFFHGFSIYNGNYYETPLGKIKISQQLVEQINQNEFTQISDAGHNSEHALEVQLPFLQEIYSHEFEIVPIVIGDVQINMLDSLAQSLYELSKSEDFLVVASSDLSHFHSYDLANQIDNEFLDMIKANDLEQIGKGFMDNTLEACGITCIYTLMKYASLKGSAKCNILDYRNSGDTAGDKFRVVGYAAGVVYNC